MTTSNAEAVERPPSKANALPVGWVESWGQPSEFLKRSLSDLRVAVEDLAAGIEVIDRSEELAVLVGSLELRDAPIHRWYYYKEGFSPRLPRLMVGELGLAETGVVLDPFAGVGTTLLGLQQCEGVKEVIGIEYSPFAHFVAQTKLAACELDPLILRRHAARLIDYRLDGLRLQIPALTSFTNERIFDRAVLCELLAARERITCDATLTSEERSFFLLGLAAIVEDMSGAMKDGRALRVRNGRRRRPNFLVPTSGARDGSGVRATLFNHWSAMIEDCNSVEARPSALASATLHRGDARELHRLMSRRSSAPGSAVGLAVFSPPYLNCVDYTEVYKLELWLLGMVENQQQFRVLREGTLRSHPSIAFPERPSPFTGDAAVFGVVASLSQFLADQLPRAPVGRMVAAYFKDMYEVFTRLAKVLAPGAAAACVVANSTFCRRTTLEDGREENWCVPILTDVLLARLAAAAGFGEVKLWAARELRPRNVKSGSARESVIVARKT